MPYGNNINNRVASYTFPTADGTGVNNVLRTNGSGSCSWVPWTGWTSYTTTITGSITNPTLGTNTQKSYYLQVGKIVFLQYWFSQTTAGTAGSGNYIFSIPSPFTIDTTVTPLGHYLPMGVCTAFLTGFNGGGPVSVYTATSLQLAVSSNANGGGGTAVALGSTYFSLNTAGVIYSMSCMLTVT
jgi:hypothetical protein